MVAFCSSTPLTSVRNLNFYWKGCLHSLPCPRGNKSSICINILNDQCSMQWSIPCIQSMHCLSDCVAICLPSEWCHGLHTCGISMGFPFQPYCARREVWRVQYNATLCVTLCIPHHLLGQLLFALPHQLTTVKSRKRYLFRILFAIIPFASSFNALRHSANILNHITKCLRNLMYTINKLRIRCVSQCCRPHVATPGIFHFNPIEHIMKCE